jgi:putative nucleotidyltransferase with HDIG domain
VEPTRAEAWQLLNETTHTAILIKHALAVEAAMRYYAAYFGEDAERWAVTGLIHDFDYEQHPEISEQHHPLAGVRILQERGWPEDMLEAIKGHATFLNVPRRTRMAQALFAVDELTGFVAACALVRPDKNVANLEVKSVLKKWKDKAFARAVNRQDMELGASELGLPLAEHIGHVIAALEPVAGELGIGGQ